MNKSSVLLVSLALLLAACTPAAALPTSAPTEAAATAVAGTAVAVTAVGTVIVPSVITAVPSNGTPKPGPTAQPGQAPTPIPTLPAGLSPSELKFRVLAAYPNLFFCDPDFYPVARDDEAALAEQRFPQLQADQEEFQAILSHNGLAGASSFSADQRLLIYREHKKLVAVRFTLTGDKYQFQLQTKDPASRGQLVTGLIDGTGAISAQQSQPSFATCPICLAAQTQIDTPRGPVAVINLRPGDLVWTVDASGARVSAPILQTGHMPVPVTHKMVHLVLADGRELWASPGHPTADGRTLGALALGDRLDGARIVKVERMLYGQPATYDLLPAGATGFYWANGILVGSTMK